MLINKQLTTNQYVNVKQKYRKRQDHEKRDTR